MSFNYISIILRSWKKFVRLFDSRIIKKIESPWFADAFENAHSSVLECSPHENAIGK